MYHEALGEFDVTVFVDEVWYRIPWYCHTMLFPFPPHITEPHYAVIFDSPRTYLTLDVWRDTVAFRKQDFKSFILSQKYGN